ncbi:alpha/beta hydrolase [Haladaptatus cibarius]|uniref:alpha/beta hydrolase n=1 Tax=Haladaptatus cibarius TaxID=453847 RepID=UPI0006788B72|nr:alpha/beta fold hydrolase [Haladaptatus cibarius]
MNQIIDNFVTSLKQHQFDTAERYFTDDLAEAYPSSKLESDWIRLTETLGEFNSVETVRTQDADPYQIRNVELQFDDGQQTLRIVFSGGDESISGLQYISQQRGTTVLPEYVDESRFSCEQVVVGSDEYPLSGEIALPTAEEPYPGVVLVHGSGPHDMDCSLESYKPFRDLGYGLASQTIGTLRYNKRTYSYDLNENECTVDNLVLDDAVNAVNQIANRKDISEVFVIGHSLGGMLAPAIIRRSNAQGGILLAANARRLEDVVIDQYRTLADEGAVDASQLRSLEGEYQQIRNRDWNDDVELLEFPVSFWDSLSDYEPVQTASDLNVPVRIAQGKRDAQISTEKDFEVWKSELKSEDGVSFRLFDDLNHLFVEEDENGHSGQPQANVADDLIQWVSNWCTTVR